jgi:hypothetical protein
VIALRLSRAGAVSLKPVMAGIARREDARERAYVPAIHVFAVENKTWTRMTRAIFLFG